ncbi:hypothetical protein BN159_6583 [Streptomyces davaonensis JCM 4913]|uniref:DUF4097 domain-containing protein n=1 Tax=Streptomyces davaonensis (strain DSM 101723 / JCM 4913 / KCC S-0913 / 768) TaxID=1214101 RepID=K4RC92_STRDJ|nr:DUF4097 family beta strand repeat-containing protein [Streptomyces davaonensis]CCK30962.1 hypothetical protein BN159_6583 [Streptomyces davaonensis JCM 4913]
MQKFDTPSAISTVLNIPAGRIQLIAADRTDTTVEIRPADPAKNRDVKAAELVEVGFSEGVLRVEIPESEHRLLGPSGSVEVTVQLPTGSGVRGKTAAVELRGVGRLGDVTYDSSQGPVKLDEVATAQLTLADGDISVGRLNGPAELRTQRGNLRIAEAATGTVTLRTEQGDITVSAAHGVSASLDAGTGYGRINNSLKNSGDETGLTIHATTSYGDITATSL